jgi:hypothetical protein
MDGGRWPAPKDTATSTAMEAARATAGGGGQRWRAAPRGARQSAWQREGGAVASWLGRRRGGGKQRGTPWRRRRMAIASGEDAGTELDLSVGAWMRARGRVGAGGMASGAWSMGEGGRWQAVRAHVLSGDATAARVRRQRVTGTGEERERRR